MKHLKPILTALVISVTFLFSCKTKDVEGTGNSCKLVKSYFYDVSGGGAVADSVRYTYTGNLITKVQLGSGDHYTLQYNGEYVTRQNNFSGASSTTPSDFLQVTYNADNTIQKVENHEKASTGYVLSYRTDFSYTAGKIVKITSFEITNNVAKKAEEYTYTYTGENITKASYIEFSTGDTDQMSFTFDNTTNYFKKQNMQLLFTDPYLASDGLSVPLIMSANNAATITYPGVPVPIPLTYQTDDKKNVTMLKVNNQPTLSYSYQCQ